MTLLTAAIALAVTQAAPPVPAPAPAPTTIAPAALDPARLAASRALIDTILPPSERQKMFERSVNALMANMVAGIMKAQHLDTTLGSEPEAQAIFAAFVERQRKAALDDLGASTPELIQAYVNAYARHFDTSELIALKAFFETPLGRKYSATSPALLSDPDFGAWQQGVAERSQRRMPAELARLRQEIESWVARKKTSHAPS
jgi:hypothetical protein